MQGLRALLVEDDPEDAGRIGAALARTGRVARLAHARDREEATRALAAEPFDVLLVDLNLPDSQGLPTVDAFVALRPELPVVVVSRFAGGDLAVAAESLRRGAQDFLAKDELAETDLARITRFACERKRAERRRLALAGRDPETGLPDLAGLRASLERARERAIRRNRRLGLVLVALGDVAVLRQDWGEAFVRALERATATALRTAVRRSDEVARIAPGRFLILLEDLPGEAALAAATSRIGQVATDRLCARGHGSVRLALAAELLAPRDPLPVELVVSGLEARLSPVEPPPAATEDGGGRKSVQTR
ncbi:Swarming motility regulation protein RssB [bacterium HR39]|nr:Swarming motility regulation protein RssB [bacterium HR39]